jgi:hypothetical protein
MLCFVLVCRALELKLAAVRSIGDHALGSARRSVVDELLHNRLLRCRVSTVPRHRLGVLGVNL